MTMDPMDAAESGWRGSSSSGTAKRKHSGQSNNRQNSWPNTSNGKYGEKRGVKGRGIGAVFVVLLLLLLLFTVVLVVGLEKILETGTKIMKATRKADCSACEPKLDILGGEKFVTFEHSIGADGCARLEVKCGLDKGTEAIIQWYQNDQDMGVSFMHEAGQTNVRRTVECNGNGQYELDENGHRGVVTAIDCIVASPHEEL